MASIWNFQAWPKDPIFLNHLNSKEIGLHQILLLGHIGLRQCSNLLRAWSNQYQMDVVVVQRNQWCGLNQSSIKGGDVIARFCDSWVFINENCTSAGMSVASWKLNALAEWNAWLSKLLAFSIETWIWQWTFAESQLLRDFEFDQVGFCSKPLIYLSPLNLYRPSRLFLKGFKD